MALSRGMLSQFFARTSDVDTDSMAGRSPPLCDVGRRRKMTCELALLARRSYRVDYESCDMAWRPKSLYVRPAVDEDTGATVRRVSGVCGRVLSDFGRSAKKSAAEWRKWWLRAVGKGRSGQAASRFLPLISHSMVSGSVDVSTVNTGCRASKSAM